MFETIFKTTTISTEETIICVIAALIAGFIISLAYLFGEKKGKTSSHLAFSLVILPAIVAIVIMLVGSDIAKAISLGGVFALVRFRSVPGDSLDITNVFFAMSAGLACGMGYVKLALCFSVIIGIIYVVLLRLEYGKKKSVSKILKITVPENLNYIDAFKDIFADYTNECKLSKTKTANLGTLYELTYSVELKSDINEKQFIDSIRCRNGNLNICLCEEDRSNISL